MRQAPSLALVLLMVTQLGPAVLGADNVTSQIAGIPTGTNIDVRLKNKQILRGARGEVSGSGFTLTNPGAGDRQIAFDEVTSVKQLTKNSHTTRNVLNRCGNRHCRFRSGVGDPVQVWGLRVQVTAWSNCSNIARRANDAGLTLGLLSENSFKELSQAFRTSFPTTE